MNLNEFIKTLYESPITPADSIRKEHLSPTGTVDSPERMEIVEGKGIFVYLKDNPHPLRGAPTPEATTAMNTVKRIIINGARTIPVARLTTLVHVFNRVTWGIASPYILKDIYQGPVTREMYTLVYNFLVSFGISPEQSLLAAKTISHIFEYDNAYRYRLQDILSNIYPHELATFRGLRRVGDILHGNDDVLTRGRHRRVGLQSRSIMRKLSYLMLIPRFRKAALAALSVANWSAFYPDEHDLHWMAQRKDYKFMSTSK